MLTKFLLNQLLIILTWGLAAVMLNLNSKPHVGFQAITHTFRRAVRLKIIPLILSDL